MIVVAVQRVLNALPNYKLSSKICLKINCPRAGFEFLGSSIILFWMRYLLRSKIHKAIVTEANLAYIGSITIDTDLIEKVGLWAGEKVMVVSNTSGNRLETYVIAGARESGVICMNGAAAHLIQAGEEIIIMGFELASEPIEAKQMLVDKHNKFVRYL